MGSGEGDRGRRASWRGGRAGAARPSSPSPRGGWARRPDRRHELAESRRRWRLAAGAGLAAGLIAGFIAYLLFLPVRTPLVAAVALSYRGALPPNAWAAEDMDRLAALDAARVVRLVRTAWETGESGWSELRRQVDGLRPGGPGKNVVIVYLSMHGAVNSRNQACLLPPDASPWEETTWISVADVLRDLFAADRPGRQPDSVSKLVVLDAARMGPNWQAGVLYNGFADRLAAAVEEAGVANLAVLAAAGPGQQAADGAELQGSPFAHYFAQGLGGAADGEPHGDGDGVVSLHELAAYVRARVGQWAAEHQAARQDPQLLPADADFPLTYGAGAEPAPPEPPALRKDPRWAEVAELWRRQESLRAAAPERWAPLAWQAFQQRLVRMEQLVLAGRAYQEAYRRVRGEANELADELARPPKLAPLAAHSIAMAKRLGGGGDWEAERRRAEAWLEHPAPLGGGEAAPPAAESEPPTPSSGNGAPQQPSGDRPAPQGAADGPPSGPGDAVANDRPAPGVGERVGRPGAAEAPPGAAGPKRQADQTEASPPEPFGYLAAAAVVWARFRQDPTHDQWTRLAPLLDAAAGAPPADFVEIHFLRMLDAYLDWPSAASALPAVLRTRELAERAAAPPDVRVVDAVRPAVGQADQRRREAEDWLFVGGPEAVSRCRSLLEGPDGAASQYEAAIQAAGELADAWALADRAAAEAPYWAQWVLEADGRPARQAAMDSALRRLAQASEALAAALARARERATAGDVGRAVAAAGEVRSALETLEDALAADVRRLRVTAGDDRATLRAIATALHTPLVGGAVRNALRDKYLRILESPPVAGDLERVAGAGETSGSGPGAPPPAPPAVRRLARWPAHPAAVLLGVASADQPPGETDRPAEAPDALIAPVMVERLVGGWAKQGEAVRRRLASLLDDVEQRLRGGGAVDGGAEGSPRWRARLAEADRLTRVAAPLLWRPPWRDPEDRPCRRRWRQDAAHWLVWQARRVLDDYWGPRPGEQAPWFELAAERLVAAADGLTGRVSPVGGDAAEVRRLLAERSQAAAAALALSPADLTWVPDARYADHGVRVLEAAGQPPGRAALWLEHAGAVLPIAGPSGQAAQRRLAVPVRGQGGQAQIQYRVALGEPLEDEALGQVTAVYRGHRVQRSFPIVRADAGVPIQVVRRPALPPRITVYGKARRQAAIMLILDCSGSMSRRLGGREGAPRRIDVAVAALRDILRRLVDPERPYFVGLRVYGRRAGWDPQRPSQVITRPSGLDLHPSEDVELVLSLGRFGPQEQQRVLEELRDVRPLGETPLYLAITQAVADLRAAPHADGRRIVVITDGFNQQTPGPNPEAIKRRVDVERALEQAGDPPVQLDIVGFDLSADSQAARRSLADLRALAEAAGGGFHPANDPTSLLRALERSLELARYTVTRADSPAPAAPAPLELGKTWVAERFRGRPTAYRVALAEAEPPVETDVVLEGGEALELHLEETPNGLRLVHRRYDHGLRDSRAGLADPADPSHRVFVGAHLPAWSGRDLRFRLSVQHDDPARFSPRPAAAWVLIRPLRDDGQAGSPTYGFYDLDFEPERPVPVLTFLAPDWPGDAKVALIQAWICFRPPAPEMVFDADRLAGEPVPLMDMPGVSLELAPPAPDPSGGPPRFTVIERHEAARTLHQIKVAMTPPPARISHRYNAAARLVRHEFTYEGPLAAGARPRVLVTTRGRFQAAAVAVAPPLRVTVPRRSVTPGF